MLFQPKVLVLELLQPVVLVLLPLLSHGSLNSPLFVNFSNGRNNLQILVLVSSFFKATGKHAQCMNYGGKYCVQFDTKGVETAEQQQFLLDNCRSIHFETFARSGLSQQILSCL